MPRPPIKKEKAKNFKGSIKRLFKELKSFKILIIIGLILAGLGSILSIMAPNKLADLIDKISEGLVINTDNLTLITNNIQTSLEKKLPELMPKVSEINLNDKTILEIMNSEEITKEEKNQFQILMGEIKQNNPLTIASTLKELPVSILNIILPSITYNDTVITTTDRLALLSLTLNKDFTDITITDDLAKLIFTEFKLDNQTITALDQGKFISLMSKKDDKSTYQKLDEAPSVVKEVISPSFDEPIIKKIIIFLISLYLISALFNYIEAIFMTLVSNNFACQLRRRISLKINKLPLKYFDKNQTGDVLSRITNDVDTASQGMNQSFASLVSAITLFIGTTIMMFITNITMALTAIVSSILGFSFMFKILRSLFGVKCGKSL